MRIPAAPGSLWLPVARRWDGARADAALVGCWRVALCESGLDVSARFPRRADARIPAAPAGTRVADLWTYDVAELFVAGAAGRYVELELGAGGHYLALEFEAPRERRPAAPEIALKVAFRCDAQSWHSCTTLPWSLIPRPPWRVNAFAIFDAQHLAFAPLPGDAPDFHQPDRYPAVGVDESAASTRARADARRAHMTSTRRS